MADRRELRITAYEFLEDRRRNRLPITVYPPPEGFERRRLYGWSVYDESGYGLAVLLRPVGSIREAEEVADELCRRHGWRRG